MSIAMPHERESNVTPERIAALMWRKSLSISSLASKLGKDRAQVSRKMHGHARWYADELIDAAAVLGTTVGYLLGETDDDRRPSHMPGYEETPSASAEGDGIAVKNRDLTIMSRAL